MRRGGLYGAAIVALLAASPVSAQTVVDGSAAAVAPSTLADVLAAVPHGFGDARGAQFRALRYVNLGQAVCGEVNFRNGAGAYLGFRPFLYGRNGGQTIILNPADGRYGADPDWRGQVLAPFEWAGCTDATGAFLSETASSRDAAELR